MNRITLIALFIALLVPTTCFPKSLTIRYTNDLHTRSSRFPGLLAQISQIRSNKEPVLLFDAGDVWHDFRMPIHAVGGEEESVDWMNVAQYDAVAVGNHDLYCGLHKLKQLSDRLDPPLLCANLTSTLGNPPFSPHTIISIDDLDILVIGLITDEFFPRSDYPWLRYVEPEAAVGKLLQQLAASVDLVVVLGHLSVSRAQELATTVAGIDVFITGHSHKPTKQAVRTGNTMIVQTSPFGQDLGMLNLELSQQSMQIVSIENKLLPIEETPTNQLSGFLRLLAVLSLTACLSLLTFAW